MKNRILILIIIISSLGCIFHDEDKITVVKAAFVYDFKGYLSETKNSGDKEWLAADNRASEDCKPYATSCLHVDDFWFCICLDYSLAYNEALAGIEDKRDN